MNSFRFSFLMIFSVLREKLCWNMKVRALLDNMMSDFFFLDRNIDVSFIVPVNAY